MGILKYPEKGRFPLEGVIIEWRKKQGDDVGKGECLLLIEVSGQLLEVESALEGTLLEVFEPIGSFVKSGDPLGVIGRRDEDISKAIKHLGKDAAEITEP